MKQHITIEQYEELSDDAKLKLIAWVSKRTKVTDPITMMYHDMTIGRMIEFLDEHSKLAPVEASNREISWHQTEELCDALWEAVKDMI